MRTTSEIATDKQKCVEEIIKDIKKLRKPRPLNCVKKKEVTEEEYNQHKIDISLEREMYLINRDQLISHYCGKYNFKADNIRRVMGYVEGEID